jgi:N-acetylglucosaminyl-diphospho-decaprenol L-rhamnosyltransferase
MSDANPQVTVITVTHNSLRTIGPFLDSLTTASATRLRVIISDNVSTDLDAVRQVLDGRDVELLENTENLGYGAGVDRAVELLDIRSRFILITNPDVIFTAGSIDALVAAADARSDGGSFGPRILESSGEYYPSARSFPSLRAGAGHAVFARIWPANPWSARYHTKVWLAEETTRSDWLSGACLLVRREAFAQISGFDHRFFMYFEDVDLGRRLTQAGWTNYFVPSAAVVHSGAASTSQNSKQMTRVHHESAYKYLSSKYTRWYFAPVRIALRVALRLRAWWLTRG